MKNTLTIGRRHSEDTRQEFNRAFNDLSLILIGYNKQDHYEVIISYLSAYKLLIGKDGAKGRLIDKLGEI